MQKIQLLIALITISAIVGCHTGPKGLPTCYVEGIVSLDGQPMDGALVTFIPTVMGDDTKIATGYSNESGKYTLTSDGGLPQKGALAGDYSVTIVKDKVESLAPVESESSRSQLSGDSSLSRRTRLTPDEYGAVSTTPLKMTVKKGKNVLNLEMKSQ